MCVENKVLVDQYNIYTKYKFLIGATEKFSQLKNVFTRGFSWINYFLLSGYKHTVHSAKIFDISSTGNLRGENISSSFL